MRAVSVGVALAIVGCAGESTGPHRGTGRLSLAPAFQTRAAASVVAFDKVRITLARTGGTALDTTVLFPPGADSLVLSLLVPINGASETLSLSLELINAAGDTVFRAGPEPVTVALGVAGARPAMPVAVRYVGVGSNAKSVQIGTRTASLFFGDSIQLTATALDSTGQPIPGTPIAWRSLDSTIARVPVDSTGKVLARSTRGLAHIQAMLLTNQADTAQVTVQPVPGAVGLLSGGGQSGGVGSALAQPVVVRVKAADSLGVQGVAVNFAVVSGGGALSKAADTTNANGDATISWTLGTVAGAQSISATVASRPSLTTTIGATAAAGAAASLSFQVPPAGGVAGAALAPAIQVAARDGYGNTATSFSGNVTLTIGGGTAGAALRGTKTVAAAAGVATFSGVSVDSAGGGYTLTASATGLSGATSSSFAIAAAPASVLVFTTQPPGSATYQTGFGFTVTARDSLGNKATTFTGAVTASIGTNPASGALSGTLTQPAVAGVATFSGVSLDNIGTGYTLSAAATGVTSGTSAAFNVVAPPGWNAWINLAGGSWTTAGNWSKGAVPVATDSIAIRQSGTYTVTMNANVTPRVLRVGAPLGAQTLSVAANTLTDTGTAVIIGAKGALALSGTGLVTGSGTIADSGAFSWTGGNLGASGAGGTLSVLPGGTFSIAPAAAVNLQGYTLALGGTGTWTGAQTINTGLGGNLLVAAGGVLNVTGTPTISLNLGGPSHAQNAGTVNIAPGAGNSFVLNDSVTGAGTWNVQSGALNLQLGGTIGGAVTVAAGATLNLFLGGTLTFGPTSSISGAGAVTMHSGTARFTGAYGLGGVTTLDTGSVVFAGAAGTAGALTLVSGAANLTDSAGAITFGGPTTWSSGGLSVLAGTLTLSGGSGAAFGGTPSLNTGTLNLGGGTFTLTSNLTALGTGALQVSGGSLVLAGHRVSAGGAFATSGSGAVTMTNANDSLVVTGNVTFGGALGTTNAGVMVLAGNFVQTGTANFQGTAQSASVAHRVVLNGASGTQTISFADPTTSYFRRLLIAKGAGSGVTLLSDVRTTYFAQTTGTTGFTGSAGPPITRLFADTIAGIGGGSNLTSPLVIQLGGVSSTAGVFTDSGTVNVDTVVFAGANQSILASTGPGTISYKSIRVAQSSGTATIVQATSLANDLVVSSGTVALNGANSPVTVTGSLTTLGTGALQSAVGGSSITVGGNATFGGASTAGLLTTGSLSVGGNFTQTSAVSTSSFAPSTGYVTILQPAATTNRKVSFGSPLTSFFDSLVVNGGVGGRDTIQLLTNITVNRGMTAEGSADVIGPSARAIITGGTLQTVLSTTSPTVTPLVVEVQAAPLAGAAPALISPDTAVFNGSIASLPTGSGIVYKSVRVNTTGAFAAPGGNVTFNGSLIVSSGTYAMSAGVDSVGGFFRTESTGALSMTAITAAPTLVVRDSAVFAGGSSTTLSGGLLRIYGSFVQRGAGTQFAATAGHTTAFAGSGAQTVTFANPGAAGSTFGNLAIERALNTVSQSAGIQLGSNIFVAGTLQDTTINGSVTDSIAGAGLTVTAAGGISTGSRFVLSNALLVLNNFTTFTTTGLTFRNMNPAATYLTMNRNTTGVTAVSGINFATAVTAGTGKYFALNTGTVSPYTWTVTTSLPAAASMTGNYVKTGSPLPTVTWNGTSLP